MSFTLIAIVIFYWWLLKDDLPERSAGPSFFRNLPILYDYTDDYLLTADELSDFGPV